MWTKLEESRYIEFGCKSSPATYQAVLCRSLLLGAVQLGHSQQIDTTPKSTVETALTELLGATIRCEQPSRRSRLLGAIADCGSGMPLPGLKAHLSTLAVGSLVFAFHPSPIASAVPAEDGVKKCCRNLSSDVLDVHPWDEYECLPRSLHLGKHYSQLEKMQLVRSQYHTWKSVACNHSRTVCPSLAGVVSNPAGVSNSPSVGLLVTVSKNIKGVINPRSHTNLKYNAPFHRHMIQ
jgi:hypothetical protein